MVIEFLFVASRAGKQARRPGSIRSGVADRHLRLHRGSDHSVIYFSANAAKQLSWCAPSSWHVADRDMPRMPVLFHDRSQVKRAKPRAIEGCWSTTK
jgi:hypothetical protein